MPGREAGGGGDGRDHGARTGLVHLHLFHPVGRLDADAAGVEADALADQREVPPGLVLLALAARAHDDHPRRVVAPLPHGEEHPHAQLLGALLVDDVDPQPVLATRSRCASSARTCGETSFAARFDSRRAMFAPSPMIRPRSAALLERPGVAPGRDEQQLVERRRRGVGVLAVDRLGLERALDDAARDELGGDGDAAVDRRRAGRARPRAWTLRAR